MTQKLFVQVYTNFGPAVKKVKTESWPDWRSVLCSCMGFASLNVPLWPLSETFLHTLRTFQSNRILTISIFSPVILNVYIFTDYDILKEVVTRLKNTTDISITSFDRDQSFQINVVHRIQMEKMSKIVQHITKKIWKKIVFAASQVRFFLTRGQTEKKPF